MGINSELKGEPRVETILTKDDLISETTELGKALDNMMNEFIKKSNEKIMANVKAQQDYALKLKEAGLINSRADEKRAMQELAVIQRQEQKKNAQELAKEQKKNAKQSAAYKELEALEKKLQKDKKAKDNGADGATLNIIKDKIGIMAAKDKAANAGWGDKMNENLKEVGNKMANGLANLGAALSNEINSIISSFSKYQSTIDTRLQGLKDMNGSGKTFKSIEKTLTNSIGASPYIKTSEMLDNLTTLVQQGIAYNLEQRTFLMSVSDKIAATFDVADKNLLQIVKLQQADSTASRLGMESYLTQFLNSGFRDTQYLSNEFDTVAGNLLQASAQMTTEQAVEFEYTVQKWLGSLSSVGFSGASTISEALGLLGSGNVSALNSNTAMRNLLTMSASRAGLDYSTLLSNGLNSDSTNKLLESMVEYLQQIASSDNQVVKSQYAQLFGVSMSDLRALSNLSAQDIEGISKSMLTYGQTLGVLESEINSIGTRMSTAEKIQNVLANAKYSLGAGIAESAALSATWAITDMIQSVTGGINLPTISVMGSSVALNTTAENLMKLGIVGISSLGMIGDVVTGLSNTKGNFSNSYYKLPTELMSRATNFQQAGLTSSSSGLTTSQSTVVGNSSGNDLYSSSVNASKDSSQKELDIAKGDAKSLDDLYNMIDPRLTTLNATAENSSTTVVATVQSISKNFDVINSIDSTVKNIYELLYRGITVNISNYGLSGGTNFIG